MARVNRMSVQKRLRERKKAEKAELKRELRTRREAPEERPAAGAATRADLEAYGVITDATDDREPS